MAKGAGVPELDADLDAYVTSHGRTGPIPHCCTVDRELMAAVERKVATGSHAWKPLAEWLTAKGDVEINRDQLSRHFNDGKPHARP